MNGKRKGGRLQRLLAWIGGLTLLAIIAASIYLVVRLTEDRPVVYASDADHFKYGSTGGERGWMKQFGFGIPYWIWVAMPELFPQYLPDGRPGRGYQSLGLIYEDGRDPRFDLPVGMSMRRTQGVDRVYFTCAVCHTGTVRDGSDAPRRIILGMPANTLDLGAVISFIGDASKDWRFRASYLLPKISELGELRKADYSGSGSMPDEFSFIDRQIFHYFGLPTMRDQLIGLLGRLEFMDNESWGPGRVDTFNSPKALLGFRMDNAPQRERIGNADFPSVWYQQARKGMWLHWDGNNCSVDERNLSAGFGTGATPATIDREAVLRIADWLWTAAPPPYPPQRIDTALASRGAPIYARYCRDCHGNRRPPFANDGDRVGQVTDISDIGTDRWRLDSYTRVLAQSQNTIYAGYPEAGEEACAEYYRNVCERSDGDDSRYRELREQCYPARFAHFRKTNGYANAPLDGIWLRAPYLHNGSVPNLRELLQPALDRSAVFYIGYDVYDYDNVGFDTSSPAARNAGWRYDTSIHGNGNAGHEGPAYGTQLPDEDKAALLEYLKTF